LVWRVDESKEQTAAAQPALLLVQADGKHQLEAPSDWNEGDVGDSFPGSENVTFLLDSASISTSFPNQARSKVSLKNVRRDSQTGEISLEVVFDA
jgi:hypothetical protein